MKKRGLIFLSLWADLIHAQEPGQHPLYSICGTVSDKSGRRIESGYVIALHPKDSSLIKGAFFMEGKYRLDRLGGDSLLLKLSSLGYEDLLTKIRRTNSDTLLDAGNTTLATTNVLKEITISDKTPLFENDGETIRINVATTNLSSGGTVIDVLRKSPGILVTGNNKISVFGKGEPLIYIDGQRIASPEVLKNLPASEIQRIELIRNPSAKYDASGSAVINIITKKADLQGYNGSVEQNYLYGKDLYLVNNLQFNLSKGKWSLSSGYGFSNGKTWESTSFLRTFTENDSAVRMDNRIYELEHCVGMHTYKAGIAYKPDSVNTIGISYNGSYNATRYYVDNTNDIYKALERKAGLTTHQEQRYRIVNHNIGTTYTHVFDTLGSELFAGMNYGNFISGNKDAIAQDVEIPGELIEQEKRSRGHNNIQLFTANVDLKRAFNRRWSMEAGLKESFVNKTGGVQFDNRSGDTWIPDPAYVNGFDFTETIFAVYTELRYKKGKFNSRAGVRSELTRSQGFSKVLNAQVFNRKYFNVFPTAFAGYAFSDDISAGITCSSRIGRPDYETLDPFIEYIDSLSSFRGNPFLLPDYSTSLEASLVAEEEVNLLTLGYTRTRGAMTALVERMNDGTNGFVMTIRNIDYSERYSVGATLPWEKEWFTTAAYFGVAWMTFTYRQNGEVIRNSRPMYYGYLYGELRLRKLFSIEVNHEYCGAGVEGIFGFKPFSMLSLSIKKSFFNNKLSCMFSANDVLYSYRERGESKVPGYNVTYSSLYNTHNYSLQLTWNFGKLRASGKQERSTNQEEYGRIKMEK